MAESGAAKKKLKDILAGIVESLGYECVGIDLSDARSGKLLRVYIDTPNGVGHTDCEATSRSITEYFDRCEEDGTPWFNGKYFVEVSSPGIERPLFTIAHYRQFVGKQVNLSLKSKKKLLGEIISCDDEGNVTLCDKEGMRHSVPLEDVKRANLVYVMEKGEKKSNRTKKSK